jgi:hypothetical protein
MADGSVRILPGDIDYYLWQTLCSILDNGSRPVSLQPAERATLAD